VRMKRGVNTLKITYEKSRIACRNKKRLNLYQVAESSARTCSLLLKKAEELLVICQLLPWRVHTQFCGLEARDLV
jgi:hypothetical protein